MAVTVKTTRKAVEIAWDTSGGTTEPEPPGGFPEYPVDPDYGIEESGPHPEHPIYLPPYIDNSLPGEQPYPDIGGPGDQPHPDQGLPGEQPRPDNTLPEGGQGGTDVDPDYGIEEGQQPGAFPGDPGYNPPSGGAVPTPNTVERLAVQVFAQGQEGDWSNTAVMPNDGLAVLSYPKDFKGESYVEVRALDGSLVDSGSITVK